MSAGWQALPMPDRWRKLLDLVMDDVVDGAESAMEAALRPRRRAAARTSRGQAAASVTRRDEPPTSTLGTSPNACWSSSTDGSGTKPSEDRIRDGVRVPAGSDGGLADPPSVLGRRRDHAMRPGRSTSGRGRWPLAAGPVGCAAVGGTNVFRRAGDAVIRSQHRPRSAATLLRLSAVSTGTAGARRQRQRIAIPKPASRSTNPATRFP